MDIIAHFDDERILSAEFGLEPGVTPSVGTVVMAGIDGSRIFETSESMEHTLEIGDGVEKIQFFPLRIAKIVNDNKMGTTNITIEDSRWKWKFGAITKEFNIIDEAAETDKDTGLRMKELSKNGKKAWTVKEIIEEIFNAMPLKDEEKPLPESYPTVDVILTNIKFIAEPPARALASVLDKIQFFVTITPQEGRKPGKIEFFTLNPNPGDFPNLDDATRDSLISDKSGKQIRKVPDQIVIVGSRIREEVEVKNLTPIFEYDPDGDNLVFPTDPKKARRKELRPLEDIWTGKGLEPWKTFFPDKKTMLKAIRSTKPFNFLNRTHKRPDLIEKAKSQFFKWFQIPEVGKDESRHRHLPTLKTLNSTEIGPDGIIRRREVEFRGKWADTADPLGGGGGYGTGANATCPQNETETKVV